MRTQFMIIGQHGGEGAFAHTGQTVYGNGGVAHEIGAQLHDQLIPAYNWMSGQTRRVEEASWPIG